MGTNFITLSNFIIFRVPNIYSKQPRHFIFNLLYLNCELFEPHCKCRTLVLTQGLISQCINSFFINTGFYFQVIFKDNQKWDFKMKRLSNSRNNYLELYLGPKYNTKNEKIIKCDIKRIIKWQFGIKHFWRTKRFVIQTILFTNTKLIPNVYKLL